MKVSVTYDFTEDERRAIALVEGTETTRRGLATRRELKRLMYACLRGDIETIVSDAEQQTGEE